MIYFVPTIIVFLIQVFLLLPWWNARKKKNSQEKRICFTGFILGQLYLLWELFLVKQTGTPAPGSPDQKMLMARLLLGTAPGGLFVILGLFYLSFANQRQLNNLGKKDQ